MTKQQGNLFYRKGALVHSQGALVYNQGALVHSQGALIRAKGALIVNQGALFYWTGALPDGQGTALSGEHARQQSNKPFAAREAMLLGFVEGQSKNKNTHFIKTSLTAIY